MAEDSAGPGLIREGDWMARSLVRDLATAGAAVTMTRDRRLPDPGLKADVRWVGSETALRREWDRGLRGSAMVLPVAPESGGLLERLARQVLRRGRILLGSRPEALRMAASKTATVRCLRESGVNAVPTRPASAMTPGEPGPWVIKPDDGVGCDGTRVVEGPWSRALLPKGAMQGGDWAVQPLVRGEPASLSLLCAEGRGRLLTVNRQWVARTEEGFRFRGCTVNQLPRAGMEELARNVARALPGLWGSVGVDLILTPEGPRVLEVNPRPTTACVGLHRALGINPADWLMRLARTGDLPAGEIPAGEPVDLALEVDRVG